MSEHTISIKDGKAEFVYADELLPLTKEGETTIVRVSHVEPHPSKPGWLADMQPIGGPVLGLGAAVIPPHKGCDCDWCEGEFIDLTPFETREEALAAEREWLRREKGL